MRVLVFKSLSASSLQTLLKRAEMTKSLTLSEEARDTFIQLAGGDARRLLNWYESFCNTRTDRSMPVQAADVKAYLKQAQTQLYDRAGDQHFDTISAFIKSLRGSHADAALLYGFRMIEAGEDPRYLLRRMMIFASEDIGNADPQALSLAVATAEAYDRLGLPEGKIPIAQCITYLATAPKSNRSYVAMNQVLQDIRACPNITIPMHLRNAPTPMMKEMGYHQGYQYPHDNPAGYIPGVQYLPDELVDSKYYQPSQHGHEKVIQERMQECQQG
jgi:putative ATPase